MSNTLTVRLDPELSEWLEAAAKRSGMAKGQIVRAQLKKARAEEARAYLRFAGCIDGPKDLSKRKGFPKK